MNLPASGALSVFSWMREPHVSETHVACIHLQYRKKEAEKNGDDKCLEKKKKFRSKCGIGGATTRNRKKKIEIAAAAAVTDGSAVFVHISRHYFFSFNFKSGHSFLGDTN